MSIIYSDFLDYAIKKNSTANLEIEIRCVVSRAYYAAYHRARAFHDSLLMPGNLPPDKKGVHATLIFQLLNPGIPKTDPDHSRSVGIGYILQGIYRLRRKADYDLHLEVNSGDAVKTILESQNLLKK